MKSISKVFSTKGESPVTLELDYRPPFDWDTILASFHAHQLPDLETVDDDGYERVFESSGRLAFFRVSNAAPRKHSLKLTITGADTNTVPSVVQSVRRMFDLDVDPIQIAQAMQGDPSLSDIWGRYPGLRIARPWSRFETAITTILGQLVSVSFGRTLIRELMRAAGTKTQHPKTGEPISLFPSPEQLRSHDLSDVRTSVMRRQAIRCMASLVVDKALPLTEEVPSKPLRKTLLAVPGIGTWSAEYIALRGFEDNDAFPATDYVLKQELKHHPKMNLNNIRPWRAYAAIALWKSFAEKKGMSIEPLV